MSLFGKEEIMELLEASQIGFWKVEFDEGLPPRFYADSVMDKLLGIEGIVTPEERFAFHHLHIHRDDLAMFEEYSDKLVQGSAEVVYRYIHPEYGEMFVRCNGKRDRLVTNTSCIKGTHQDISETVRLEKDKLAEKRLAEKNRVLVEQLDIIQTLARPYNSSYYIDMKTGEFFEIASSSKIVRELIGEKGNAQEKFNTMCDHIVKPEFADEMRSFTDLSTVNKRLKNKLWIGKDFEGRNGWSEGMFIAANRNEDGNCEHIIWATRSINQFKRKEIEQQEELIYAKKLAEDANKAKTNFLFNMSHDIRTPMNAIMGFTDLIEKYADDKQRRDEYIKKIRNASKFLLSLINNVLEMSRIESGKVELEEKVCSMEEVVDIFHSVFEEQMKQKHIDFTVNVDVEHDFIYCDIVKLREIFLNILSNAYKYTSEGGKVNVETIEMPSDREGYALYRTIFSDNGMGMTEEYLPHLFEAFSREQSVTENKIEGTGLGMPIVKKLVEICDGKITVESKKGVGTTFAITMYHRIADGIENTKTEFDDTIGIDNLVGKRVLLAEDNELNAEITIELLKELGIKAERAEDGIACLEKLNEHEADYYDLILMDIQMPRLNGLEATQKIRQMENEVIAKIPIIAMTANAFEEDKREAINSGMNGHVAKPVSIQKLSLILAGALKK